MKLTKLVKIAESLNKKAKYKKPNYPSLINEENTKELEAAGAVNAGKKAIRMTARQLGTTEAAVRAARTKERKRQKEIADSALFSGDVKLKPKKQPRISRRETLPDEEELDKRLGYSKKGEGFAGYENDQDPETHVKIQAKDHARTGSAQQAQYDGTEGKAESKEKPLKVLTDGELEEVEKLKALALETKNVINPSKGQLREGHKPKEDEYEQGTSNVRNPFDGSRISDWEFRKETPNEFQAQSTRARHRSDKIPDREEVHRKQEEAGSIEPFFASGDYDKERDPIRIGHNRTDRDNLGSEEKTKPASNITEASNARRRHFISHDEASKLKAMVKLLKRDDWDKDERRGRKHEEFPVEPDSPDDIPDDAKRKIQTDMRSEVRGKKVPKDIKQEGVDLDEKIGEELGEVPRSRVQGEREGRRTVSDQGKHVGNKFIDDASRYYARRQAATDEKPSQDEIKDVADNAQTIGHALTYEKEEAEKWKSFIKAVNTVNKRRGRGRRSGLPKVIEKEGTNAANGTSPRGGNFLGTNDTEAFNVRHNGGRNTKRIGKKPEDLGNFP